MSQNYIEKDLYFCPSCLAANNLNDYNLDNLKNDFIKLSTDVDKLPLFENLCFSGGGVTTIAYLGALEVLESLGLLKNSTRFSGSSAGAIYALMFSLNCDFESIRTEMMADINPQDRYLISALYNAAFNKFSLYTGDVLTERFKALINKRFDEVTPDYRKNKSTELQEYDPTFDDVYKVFGRELIITSVNLNLQKLCYFSPKLTPNMPVYLAVRMSTALPFIFEAVDFAGLSDGTVAPGKYVDGGVGNNFPLHVFHSGPNQYIFSETSSFEKTIGLKHCDCETYRRLADGTVPDSLESDTDNKITNFLEYAGGILETLMMMTDLAQIQLVDALDQSHDVFFQRSVLARIPHLKIIDFNAPLQVKQDAMTIFKVQTIQYLLKLAKLV